MTQGNQLISALNKTAKIEPPDRENTWENIKELCGKIGPNTVEGNLFIGTKGIGTHIVFTLIVDNMQRTRSWIDRILSFSSFLATDLIDLLSAFEAYSHFRLASEQLMIVQNTGIPIGNKDLSLWAGRIFNYARLISELESYGQKYLTMTYEDRPGLVWSEDNPTVPKPD